jgi:hypothetical protein
MRKLLWLFPFALIFVGATMFFERPAYAYADPGTGLLAIQAVGSMLVAAGWYLRRKIYSIFHRESANHHEDETAAATESEGSALR